MLRFLEFCLRASTFPQPNEEVTKANIAYLAQVQTAISSIEAFWPSLKTDDPIGLGETVGTHSGTQAKFEHSSYAVAMRDEGEYKSAFNGLAINALWATCPGVRYNEEAIMDHGIPTLRIERGGDNRW